MEFFEKHEKYIVPALLLLGALLRLLFLDVLPYGLNQDEASAAYDAWAILNHGIDRNGNSLPVLLEAWGSGQNALYSYLAMPFIALLGLSVSSFRLTGALFGVAALVIFWLLARRTRGVCFGLAALLFLAVNPWHIMASRWALESNLLPVFLLAGIYLTSLAADRHWLLVGAAACFGLSIYAYGTAFFFLPPFLLAAVIWLLVTGRLERKSFLVALAVFVVIALPIALCQLLNVLGMDERVTVLGITLPRLTEGRQLATSVFGKGGGAALFDNVKRLFMLLLTQSDGLSYNALPKSGIVYGILGLLLFVSGLITALRDRRSAELPVLLALFSALLCGALIDVNINRINMLWLPVIYFCALGLCFFLGLLKRAGWIFALVLAAMFGIFALEYTAAFSPGGSSGSYFPGLGEAIAYAESLDPESIYISDYVNQPYIYALFYSQTPPQEFISTVDYVNPDSAFRQVRSFGRYRFGDRRDTDARLLVLHMHEADEYLMLRRYGNYAVCEALPG